MHDQRWIHNKIEHCEILVKFCFFCNRIWIGLKNEKIRKKWKVNRPSILYLAFSVEYNKMSEKLFAGEKCKNYRYPFSYIFIFTVDDRKVYIFQYLSIHSLDMLFTDCILNIVQFYCLYTLYIPFLVSVYTQPGHALH